MATAPQPQMAPAGAGVSPADQQANPLQTALAQMAKVCETMAQQNPLVADELTQARGLFVQALQKTMMSAQPQPAANPTPQEG